MPTAPSAPNVSNRTASQNAEMFARTSAAARIRNVYQSTMSLTASACQVMEVKLLMPSLDADHCQPHAHCHLNAHRIHTAAAELAGQLVLSIKSALWTKFAWKANA